MMKHILMFLSVLLPWPWRRSLLEKQFGYSIHPSSHIGLCWIFPRRLIMEENSRIGHLTVCKNIDLLHLGPHAIIGQLNWITGFPSGTSRHFAHQADRHPELDRGDPCRNQSRHLIDCTARVRIGAVRDRRRISISADHPQHRSRSGPAISRADRDWRILLCGTNCVMLGGTSLPHHSVLGAQSLLNKKWDEPYRLYGGVPAKPLKELSQEMEYFRRTQGFVW